MHPVARRLWTVLPAVLVAGGVAAVLLRASTGTDARDRAEASIRARWDAPSEAPSVRRDLSVFYDRYGKAAEARWFAIEAYARIGDTASAFDVWRRDPEAWKVPGGLRHLADVLLHALEHVPGAPTVASAHEPRVLQALVEGGDAPAAERLRSRARSAPMSEIQPYYAPISRAPTAATRVLAEGLLVNDTSAEAQTAGAVLASSPKDRTHVAFLAKRLASPWRNERIFMWQHIARALGTAGGPEAVAALEAAVKLPVEANTANDRQRHAMQLMALDAGLLLAGDLAARERLFPAFVRTEYEMAGLQLAMGWTLQWVAGDTEAVQKLADLWNRAPGPVTRLQIAVGCFLTDAVQPPEMPCNAWADDLSRETKGHLPRALAHIWRYRRGAAGAAEATITDFEIAAHAIELSSVQDPEGDEVSSAMEVLRAWYRWGGASAK